MLHAPPLGSPLQPLQEREPLMLGRLLTHQRVHMGRGTWPHSPAWTPAATRTRMSGQDSMSRERVTIVRANDEPDAIPSGRS